MSDTIDHPAHYNAHPAGIECIDVVEHLGFNVGNAIKYLWRAGLKTDDPTEDLRKAVWYVQREIGRVGPSRSVVVARDVNWVDVTTYTDLAAGYRVYIDPDGNLRARKEPIHDAGSRPPGSPPADPHGEAGVTGPGCLP